jgi:hypothetical protein
MDKLLIQQHSISDGETGSPNACVTNQPTNQRASDSNLFCLAIPALTASLGSATDIFSYNW